MEGCGKTNRRLPNLEPQNDEVFGCLHDAEFIIRQSAVRVSSLPPHSLTGYTPITPRAIRAPHAILSGCHFFLLVVPAV